MGKNFFTHDGRTPNSYAGRRWTLPLWRHCKPPAAGGRAQVGPDDLQRSHLGSGGRGGAAPRPRHAVAAPFPWQRARSDGVTSGRGGASTAPAWEAATAAGPRAAPSGAGGPGECAGTGQGQAHGPGGRVRAPPRRREPAGIGVQRRGGRAVSVCWWGVPQRGQREGRPRYSGEATPVGVVGTQWSGYVWGARGGQ